jgi:hypothetical protein
MASAYQKHYRPTQVLKSFLKFSVIAFTAIITFSCAEKKAEKEEIIVIDSLLTVLQSDKALLDLIETEKIADYMQEINDFLLDERLSTNIAALGSLENAAEFMQNVKNEKTLLLDEINVALKQLSDLKSDIQENLTDQRLLHQYIVDEQLVVNIIRLKVDYLSNRWHAQLLLLETLQNAYTSDESIKK